MDATPEILVNRAPFLTLWASVVARRLGYAPDEALTLGRAIAGQTAAAKATRLGLAARRPEALRAEIESQRRDLGAQTVELMGRTLSCVRTAGGLRALADAAPIDPASVRRALATKFKEHEGVVEAALVALAASYEPHELNARAMDLYMAMRPATAAGRAGWGQVGRLDLAAIDRLRARREAAREVS